MTFPFVFTLFKRLLCSTFIFVVVNYITIINMYDLIYFITNINCNTNYSNYCYDYYCLNIYFTIIIIAIFMIIIIIIVAIKSLIIIIIII